MPILIVSAIDIALLIAVGWYCYYLGKKDGKDAGYDEGWDDAKADTFTIGDAEPIEIQQFQREQSAWLTRMLKGSGEDG